MEDYHENVIEFLKGQDIATTSLSKGGRLYNRVKRLADKFPDKCQIIVENKDSIMAHIPESWVKINPPRKINLTEEQRKKRAEKMREIKKRQKESRENAEE